MPRMPAGTTSRMDATVRIAASPRKESEILVHQ
jgi:hypothetical protein